MSPGYRQIIILDRLSDGISRNNWFRGPSGQLVDIQRQDGQAFVVSPEGFPVGPRRSITRSGGFGYAGLEAGIPSSYRQSSWQAQSHASIAFDGWWPMVAGVETLGGSGYSSYPFNGWVSRIDNLYGVDCHILSRQVACSLSSFSIYCDNASTERGHLLLCKVPVSLEGLA